MTNLGAPWDFVESYPPTLSKHFLEFSQTLFRSYTCWSGDMSVKSSILDNRLLTIVSISFEYGANHARSVMCSLYSVVIVDSH